MRSGALILCLATGCTIPDLGSLGPLNCDLATGHACLSSERCVAGVCVAISELDGGEDAGARPPGLIVGFGFSTDGGTTAIDASGHGTNGTLVGDVAFGEGRYGTGLVLDGGYVHVSDIDEIDNLQNITVSTWFRSAPGVRGGHFLDKSRCETTVSRGPLEMGVGLQTPGRGGILLGRTSGVLVLETPGSVLDGTWHHLAATYDGHVLRLLLDGVEQATLASEAFQLGSSLMSLELGGNCNGRPFPWLGGLDDVRIYGRALSAEELEYDFRHGLDP